MSETPQAAEKARCPYCDAGPGEHCRAGCHHLYRQQAGQTRRDGADYLRDLWVEQGAPTIPAGKTSDAKEAR